MAVLFSSSLHHPLHHTPFNKPNNIQSPLHSLSSHNTNIATIPCFVSKRDLIFHSLSLCSLTLQTPPALSASASASPSSKSFLSGIANTKSWFQFFGDGFSIRIPPLFQDLNEPEDFNAGAALYGDKVKPKKFSARFASSDGSEVVTVISKPTNQLKITFLEAQDVTDFGSLKEAARIFIPVGSTVFAARTIKIKEDEGFRTYYFYEFGRDEQRVALVAAINSGRAIVAGASAPESKWDSDGVKLRSAAMSLTVT